LGLLGHELTHVGQYRKGMNAAGYLWRCRNYPDCDYEREASAVEDKINSELKEGCYPDKIKK
jgi:ssDNA-binding Zn-finger/Zn-ribbon topoisomerase 1